MDTNHTVTQPAYTTFLSRDHHSLHIPSMLLDQLQGRAGKFGVRLNSPDPAQYLPLLACLSAMTTRPNNRKNLIRDAIISLAQYGLHFRDIDKPVLTITLQLLLYDQYQHILLDQLFFNPLTILTSPFTITGDRNELIPYALNQNLHQWLDKKISDYTVDQHDNQPLLSPPSLYKVEELLTVIDQATLFYHQCVVLFLSFIE